MQSFRHRTFPCLVLIVLGLVGPGRAQATPRPTFAQAAATVQQQLEQSVAELQALREQLAAEKIPLSRRLAELEAELTKVRAEHQQRTRAFDGSTLDLGNLRAEIKAQNEEASYLGNLLGEYGRNLESRLHIAELQRYRVPLEAARLAPENRNLTEQQVFAAQAALLDTSLDRLEQALGGTTFDGTAVDPAGTVQSGMFVLVGPVAVFRSADGSVVGTAEQRLGSLEPTIVPLPTPELAAATEQLVARATGMLPFDPTLGNAHKLAATEESLWQHIQRGGPVMGPILLLAAVALLVALVKWVSMLFVRKPSKKKVAELIEAVASKDQARAAGIAAAIDGPAGEMLTAGVEHLHEPPQLVEEVMYETVLATRLRLKAWLPFIAITASSAPLLGLLGTVTGIMNTFTLMTTFGTGDPKTLSSGISEALITTEFGLYVAIPALLLYALLSRKATRVIDQMEQCAVALVNQLGKTPLGGDGGGGEEAAA